MIDSLIDFLLTFFQPLYDLLDVFFQGITDFYTQDIYPFITKTFAQWIKSYLIAEIEFKMWSLKFCWDVAKDLLATLNVSPLIEAAWSSLDSKVLQFLTFFRVPEGINLLISAYTTKFVYKFAGF